MNSCSVERDKFSTKIGFVLTCIGSAVGMGNIWLFPYRLGQYGGAAFLIPYTIFMALLGCSGVVGEMAFGRAMRTGPLGAFQKALKMRGIKRGHSLGVIPLIGCLLIGIGYSVVVGWIIKFIMGSITGSVLKSDSVAYFEGVAGNFSSIPWHMIALVLTFLVMIIGVSSGIEKLNKIVMPAFFIMFLGLAIFMFFVPGSFEGYVYLFKPDWSCLFNPKTWISALGQAFFSLSLAGSGTIIYGSYLSEKEDVISCAKNVVIFSYIASILAALVIIPSVFAFGLEKQLQSGPPLMFITMPTIFKALPMGRIIAILFFVAVLFAAITSLINLFEAPVELLQTQFKFSRNKAVLIVAAIAATIGIFIENAEIVGTWMDLLSVYVVPLGALLAGIMFFWICGKNFVREQVQLGRDKKIGPWFEPMTRYVFIGLILIVYVLNIVF